MKKRLFIAALGVLAVIGVLGGIKVLQIQRMIAQGKQFRLPPTTVTTATAENTSWEQTLTSVGSLSAVQGVMISSETAGKVVKILFEPGSHVNAGDLLVQLDTESEKAQLRSARAAAEVAKLSLQRTRKLLAQRSIAQSEVDSARAQHEQAVSQVDNILTAIAKKNIQAPFSGRLGIRLINLGQFINAGDAIVSLQSLDPIFVDFTLPQQSGVLVETGFSVRLGNDAMADTFIQGKVTAINPQVDADTRAIKIQATIQNHDEKLLPGMFVNVDVILPAEKPVTVIPATAVLYAPFGDSVFVVEEKKSEDEEAPQQVVRQQFVRLGEKRGDFVALESGLSGNETIVGSGVFKLRNGQAVVTDNTLAPDYQLTPSPQDS